MSVTDMSPSRKEEPSTVLAAIGRVLLCFALLASILPKGSAWEMAFRMSCLPIGAAALIAVMMLPRGGGLARSMQTCLALAAALCGYILLQSLSFDGNPFAHPVWEKANALIDHVGGAISVEPSATRSALFTLLAPLLVYASTVSLFGSDFQAFRMLKFLGVLGAGFALFGLVQISLLPDSLLFYEKISYRDSLTSIFVNRNTAGTFLGLASFVILTLLIRIVRETRGPAPLKRLFSDPAMPRERRVRAFLWALLLPCCVLGLFLTKSRGAMLSALVSYMLIVPLLYFDSRQPSARQAAGTTLGSGRDPQWRAVAAVLVSVAIIAAVAIIFGAQSFARLETQGVDVARFCVYAATLRAFSDNWLFGTGFGTFASVFPGYRTPDCAGAYAMFFQAHNFYLEGLLGLGLALVPALVVGYHRIGADLWRGCRQRQRLRFVPIIGFGALLFVTLHSLVDFSLQLPGMASFAAAYFGAITVISVKQTRRRPNRSGE